jgi:hypothetical protein
MGYNDDEAQGRLAREMKEWAVRDEATGTFETYCAGRIRTWMTYASACSYVAAQPTVEWRVVPAPPREMTDEECWAWLEKDAQRFNLMVWHNMKCWQVAYLEKSNAAGEGATPCGAIRAARKKLEGR